MNKTLPNTAIRKALYNLINPSYSIYDTRVTGVDQPEDEVYILMTTQTAIENNFNNCEDIWDATILLDFVDIYQRQGNVGTRLRLDSALDDVRDMLDTTGLSLSDGLEVIDMRLNFPSGITDVTETEVVQRAFIRIELKIK